MKNSLKFMVLTILTFGTVHNYRINNQNLAEEPQKYKQKSSGSDSSHGGTAYKWDCRTYGYGLSETINPPRYYEFHGKEHRRYPKEIPRWPYYGYNYYGPELKNHGYPPGNVFEYPTHPLLLAPQGEAWPARDPKNWSLGRWDFNNADADRLKARFPVSLPASPSGLTSSSLSEMRTQSCINSCPSTSEYNPVCGTNGVTYDNPGKLECAKYCGVGVALKRQAPCNQATNTQPPTINTEEPFQSSPTKPATSSPILVEDKETSNPLADLLIFVSTESPDNSAENFDIDIRSRNLKPEDEIVFED